MQSASRAVWAFAGQSAGGAGGAGGAGWSRVELAPTAAGLGAAVLLGSLVIETSGAEPTKNGWIGGSIDVPLDQHGDIYIDAADSTATGAWLDPVKAQTWVLAQLKAQGIVMRAA